MMKTTMKTTMKSSPRLGVSAVEAALLIPLVMMLLMGMLEYGWAYLKNQQINSAARHGARVGAVEGATSFEVAAAVSQLMTEAGMDASGYVLTTSPADVAGAAPGSVITVSITVPYADIQLMGIPLIPVPTNLDGLTSMAKEGPMTP